MSRLGIGRAAVVVALALAEVGAPGVATAQPTADVAAARRHFEQAEAYFRTGAFDDAAAAYQAAYDAAPRAVLLFNVGLAWENHGDAEAAVAAYDRYLAAEPDGVKAVEARARRAALATTVEERRATRAREERAATLRREAAAHTAAGRHDDAIAALRAAHELVPDPELDFALGNAYLAAGDRVRAESAFRRYLAGEGAGVHRDDAAARLRELEQPADRPQPVTTTRASQLPAIIAFSTGGAALVVGIFYGLHARSIDDELANELEQGQPPLNTSDPRFDDGKRASLIANVAFGVAGVATLAGGYLAYRAWSTNRRARDTVAVLPVATSGRGAGVALEVRW